MLAFLTPLASTALLLAVRGERPTIWLAAATVLIVGAALVAVRSSKPRA